MGLSSEQASENGKKGGRPVGTKGKSAEAFCDYLRARLESDKVVIVDKWIAQIKGGNEQARKDAMDRAYGRAKETIDLNQKVVVNFDE